MIRLALLTLVAAQVAFPFQDECHLREMLNHEGFSRSELRNNILCLAQKIDKQCTSLAGTWKQVDPTGTMTFTLKPDSKCVFSGSGSSADSGVSYNYDVNLAVAGDTARGYVYREHKATDGSTVQETFGWSVLIVNEPRLHFTATMTQGKGLPKIVVTLEKQ